MAITPQSFFRNPNLMATLLVASALLSIAIICTLLEIYAEPAFEPERMSLESRPPTTPAR